MKEGFIYPMAAPDIPVNLLVNSCFLPKYRINQRGLTSYEGMGIYTIDRWQVWLNSVDLVSGGIRTSQMYQLLAGLDLSKTYTFAVCDTKGSITVVSGVFGEGAKSENGTTAIRLSVLNGYAEVVIENKEKDKTYVWAVLYSGAYTADTFPTPVPRPYSVELDECQRYYFVAKGYFIGMARAYDNGMAYGSIFVPTMMRTNPTINPTNLRLATSQYSDSYVTVSGISNVTVKNNQVSFWLTSDALIANTDYFLSGDHGVEISADL